MFVRATPGRQVSWPVPQGKVPPRPHPRQRARGTGAWETQHDAVMGSKETGMDQNRALVKNPALVERKASMSSR